MNYYDTLIFRLSTQHYDCVFTVNFLPIIAKCCNRLHVPYVCWTIDNPINELYSDTIQLPWNRIFYFDRSQYEQFAPRSPEHSYYMPLACDADYLKSVQLSEEDHLTYDCDISFIGSTYEEKCPYNTVADKLPPYLHGFAEGMIQAQCNVYGLHFIEDTLTEKLCSEFIKHANQIANISSNPADFRSIIADSYIGRKCTVLDRLITLQNISKHYSLDLYTTSNVSNLTNAKLRGSVDYETVMPKIIKCSKINLNMTSRSIRTGLPLRIYDILGAGGFLLTNYQPELPELFEIGKDLVVYESQPDLLAQINYYLKHDDIRQEIAKNGQNKVQELYSYKVKLEHMIHIALDKQ